MIERLQKAGAIIFARTTTPEFCLSGITTSRMWGITRNPWNTEWGPGGSSGGSGAALAAGLTTLATGTDIGGSIRIPAAACGVVGFKPPHGRNPDGPPANFDRFNHCGPMTRSVADAALMQNITSGPHPLDHDSLRQKVRLPSDASSIKGMKIAYSVDFDYVPVEPDVRANTMAALDVFRSLGAEVEEVEARLDGGRRAERATLVQRHAFRPPDHLAAEGKCRPDDGLCAQVRGCREAHSRRSTTCTRSSSRRTACTRHWGQCWPRMTCSSVPPTTPLP